VEELSRGPKDVGNQQLTNDASWQGLFLAENRGHFAEKQGSPGIYFALFFAFSRFFGIVSVAIRCVSGTSGDQDPPKKIVPENLP
jgi:hypothetical protein